MCPRVETFRKTPFQSLQSLQPELPLDAAAGPQEILCPLAQLSAELDKLRDQGWRPVSLEYLTGRQRGQARLIAIPDLTSKATVTP
jgi:hypothetical protein